MNNILFRKQIGGVLLRCLEWEDSKKVLKELHSGLSGGNFCRETRTHKVISVRYYGPTLIKNALSLA